MKRAASLTLYLALVIVFIFGSLEMLVRLLPEARYASNIVFDPILGHRGPLSSNVELSDLTAHYNQFGFRDRDYNAVQELNKDINRIVILGDSITEGINLPEPMLWPQWTEYILNSAIKKTSSLYKFATSDWGTYQEVLALEKLGKTLKPNVVILQFLGINDFINNGIQFALKNSSENDDWRPYFNNETEKTIYAHKTVQTFRKTSRIYRYLEAIQINNHLYGKPRKNLDSNKCKKHTELFLEKPIDPAWKQAFDATNGIAKAFANLREKDQTLLAVYFPSTLEILDNQWNTIVVENLKRCNPGAAVNRRQAEMIFLNAFSSVNIEALSLFGPFAKYKNPQELFDITGHLTTKGHQIAGEEIAFYLFNKKHKELGGKK